MPDPEAEGAGVSMPINFIVASILSRSLRSFSSSTVSTFLALGTPPGALMPRPVMGAPAFNVKGLSLSFFTSGAGVADDPPNKVVIPFQSIERPRRARFSVAVSEVAAGVAAGASGAEAEGAIAAEFARVVVTESELARLIPGADSGSGAGTLSELDLVGKNDDTGRGFLGFSCGGGAAFGFGFGFGWDS